MSADAAAPGREHLKAVVDACANLEPAPREVKIIGAAASAYSMVPLDLDPKPLVIAEEMNTTTRVEHFKNMVRTQNYDGSSRWPRSW